MLRIPPVMVLAEDLSNGFAVRGVELCWPRERREPPDPRVRRKVRVVLDRSN